MLQKAERGKCLLRMLQSNLSLKTIDPKTNELHCRNELVTLGDIENIYKKRKHDKEARLETVRVM